MKKNILLILISAFALVGCNFDLGFINIGENQKNTGKTVNNSENTTQNPQISEVTKTIYTSGESIEYFASSPGVTANSNLLSGVDAAKRLEKCLKDQLNNNKYLSSAIFTNVNSANFGTTGYQIIQLGSGKNDGSFEWNCASKIYNVEIKGYLYDEEVQLKINNESLTFSDTGTASLSISSGATKLTIASICGRVHIESLKLTWKS
jgi:hypothetical protein